MPQSEITIKLPFPLITWNRLLAMNQWDRKKYRDWIHRAVCISIQEGFDSLTWTESVERLQSMGLSLADYYQMIRPKKLPNFRIRKKKSAVPGRRKKR